MRLGLSFRWNRFTKRQNLCRDWLDLAFVDQVRDLSEIFGIRMNPNSCSANPRFASSARIGTPDQIENLHPFRDSETLHKRLAAFAHGFGNPREITFFPECFVWIHFELRFLAGLSLGKYFSALTLQPFNALTPQ